MEYPQRQKIISDPVHTTIEFNKLLFAIIDTREFQRLREIQQLPGVSHVYPGATHTCFSHSIGICHMAKKVGEAIHSVFTELEKRFESDPPNDTTRTLYRNGKITDKDILCLQIAGLCRYLGQGPFTDVFSEVLNFQPEEMSVKILRQIFENDQSSGSNHFQKNQIGEEEILIIEKMIRGQPKSTTLTEKEKAKLYLYQVINNKVNGVDVAKWDALLRDATMCSLEERFNFRRVLQTLQISETDDGVLEICFRDRDADVIYNMFRTADIADHKIYKHKVVHAVNLMYKEVFKLVRNEELYPDKTTGRKKSIVQMIGNNNDFIRLTDSLFDGIHSGIIELKNENLRRASKMLERIKNRDFFSCVYEERENGNGTQVEEDKTQQIQSKVKEHEMTKQFLVDTIYFPSGMNDPRKALRFYSKRNILKGTVQDLSLYDIDTRDKFISRKYRVYFTGSKNEYHRKENKEKLDLLSKDLRCLR